MKDLTKYNSKFGIRLNRLIRTLFINSRNRKHLQNTDFSLICNNCNGGVITHDLNLEFRSPTVNMFFPNDHFFRFCENFNFYLEQELTECHNPSTKPDGNYPVGNLGDLELHFMHYHSFAEAKEKWDSRSKKINRENLFFMWTFFDKTDLELLNRFEKMEFKNKIAFTEREFPEYQSSFCIHGYESGLGVLTLFDNLRGKRKIDQFDYVSWFNNGEIKRAK